MLEDRRPVDNGQLHVLEGRHQGAAGRGPRQLVLRHGRLRRGPRARGRDEQLRHEHRRQGPSARRVTRPAATISPPTWSPPNRRAPRSSGSPTRVPTRSRRSSRRTNSASFPGDRSWPRRPSSSRTSTRSGCKPARASGSARRSSGASTTAPGTGRVASTTGPRRCRPISRPATTRSSCTTSRLSRR